MTPRPLTRITITVAEDLVRRADARAKLAGRSRSWVIAEALRGYLAGKPSQVGQVREPASAPYAVSPGLGEQRLAQLQADMALTPEQRVREAEEMVRTATLVHPQPRYQQVLLFDSFEDYFAWKKRERLW